MTDSPAPSSLSLEGLIQQAFKAGYHCQWIAAESRYIFDPNLSPGDPDGAFKAWADADQLTAALARHEKEQDQELESRMDSPSPRQQPDTAPTNELEFSEVDRVFYDE